MSKLDLTYKEKIHLDKWNIDVKPYLTMSEMGLIYDAVKDIPNPLERKNVYIADVLVVCTDLYEDESANYEYEQILYSGLWNDIMTNCPMISQMLSEIEDAVKEYRSVENTLLSLVKKTTKIIDNIDMEVINEIITQFKKEEK